MKIYKISVIALMVLIVQIGYGQVTVDDNVPVTGRWVGFDNFSGIPLPIENRGFPEIDISSAGTNKFAITELATWNGLNSLTLSDVQRTTLGLQGESNLAWSMLHLWSGTLPAEMQRDWMNVGTSYTANIDYMYSGLLERPNTGGNDLATDAVVAWGCQPETTQNGNTDNFRFLFLEGFSGIPNRAAQTQQGREMMRISPVGNVGIGDFSSNGYGLAEQPTQRLDVDGTARMRQMPLNEMPDVFVTGRQVDAVGDYILTYTPFDDVDFSDCRWKESTDVIIPSQDILYMGFDENADCYRSKLGIGAIFLRSKLQAECNPERDQVSVAIAGSTRNQDPNWEQNLSSGGIVGVVGSADGVMSSINHIGIEGNGVSGKFSVGVLGQSRLAAENSFGVYATAQDALSSLPNANIALYGEVFGSSGAAAYLVGSVVNTSVPINISDQLVKTDIQDITSASEVLSQLSPKTYIHVSPENRSIAFDDDLQYGLIAQEVQEILPDIVEITNIPQMRDSLGNFIDGTAVELLGIQYTELIPILIAGFQEQNALISEQEALLTEQEEQNEDLEAQLATLSEQLENQAAQMAEMQNQMTEVMASFQSTQSKMSNCCGTTPTEKGRSETGGIELEQNFPNPFDEVTTINFSLDKPAQIRLEISDSQGRVLEVLVNQLMDEGEYTERWDASAFAPGTYYYSLYADTELLTKKMIKR